ncbi:MAG TPA: S-adenosylmethionine:tRNA ribosyltransferase-isomerase, partial [Myxococcales bacterium]|nr:S-adenosylmethionine:tRNA ribosyltransferase-isomerase [Myxococcales bacterium]
MAQHPAERRDASRLLVLRRAAGALEHRVFAELPELLSPSDLLVVNDARVVPARLLGRKAGTGGKVELLLVRPAADSGAGENEGAAAALGREISALPWICLGQASKGLKPGALVELEADLRAEILESRGEGEFLVRFSGTDGSLLDAIHRAGRLPLPPYIERPPAPEDSDRYQTIYARSPGSVAAPTAGLHFTPEVLDRLRARGVSRA